LEFPDVGEAVGVGVGVGEGRGGEGGGLGGDVSNGCQGDVVALVDDADLGEGCGVAIREIWEGDGEGIVCWGFVAEDSEGGVGGCLAVD
jgi:hypothetical protein